MSTELKIPDVGESIQEVQIGRWLKHVGDQVRLDEIVVELETDKASMELPAPITGTLSKILKQDGETVLVGETIAHFEEAAVAAATDDDATDDDATDDDATDDVLEASEERAGGRSQQRSTVPVTPSGRRAVPEYGLKAEDVTARGKRIRREDVERFAAQHDAIDRNKDNSEATARTTDTARATRQSSESPSRAGPGRAGTDEPHQASNCGATGGGPTTGGIAHNVQ